MYSIHSFHIPVMGTGFTLDTPLKVAQYGISSVISLVDDYLIEQIRAYYCKKTNTEYVPITEKDEDCRANRITAYLNMLDSMVKKEFERIRSLPFNPGSEICKYFDFLSDDSPLKKLYKNMLSENSQEKQKDMQDQLRKEMQPGTIDVNIMTKLDKINYDKNRKPLNEEFSDALAALRGYAKSTLSSNIIFSAGINRRLYSYIAKFKDFYANAKGEIKKKIVLKVSDYRSAMIQGRFLAQKGLWVSEYRVESGINCGGHAFIANGNLMGPILEDFKNKREDLIAMVFKVFKKAVELKDKIKFSKPLNTYFTAQGGVCTSYEHNMLLDYYKMDSIGWGSSFLFVPEVTAVDENTLNKLCDAKLKDFEVSNNSPLGVPFNNLKNSEANIQRELNIKKGSPGSLCPKRLLVSNTEFTDIPICTASKAYQSKKLKELQASLSAEEFEIQSKEIMKKECICHQLGDSILMKYNIHPSLDKAAPSICPGPNIAYFNKTMTLEQIIDHIYGRKDMLDNSIERVHMFIDEIILFVDDFMAKVRNAVNKKLEDKDLANLKEYQNNILNGVKYYQDLFLDDNNEKIKEKLNNIKEIIEKALQLDDNSIVLGGV